MQKLISDLLTKGPNPGPKNRRKDHGSLSSRFGRASRKSLWVVLLAGTMLLSACGGGSSSTDPQSAVLSGNWQFAMNNPDSAYPASQLYGLQGGFLLQQNIFVTGQAVYSISGINQSNGNWGICDSGSAQITGTLTGQTVNLMAVAGSQTFALKGTLGSDGSITNATFTTPGGTATGFTLVGNTSCGMPTPAAGLAWSATPVPPLAGSIQGSFHSVSSATGADSGLANQNFPVTGALTQGPNIGASNATVTGTLSFVNPTTLISDYPCLATVFVNGQISGNTVVLQLIGTNGANVGQIGIAPSESNGGQNGSPVTLNSTPNGYVLQSTGTGTAYVVNTPACPDNASVNHADVGNVCLALNSTTACEQPITLSPAIVTFQPQLLGSTSPTTQTITLTNNSGQKLDDLTLAWFAPAGSQSDAGQTDFTNLANFTEQDNCVPGGETFTTGQGTSTVSLMSGQSCAITVAFVPQESCTWLPGPFGGTSPAQCPLPLTATVTVTVNNVPSVAINPNFLVPITGTGISFVQSSSPELDFGAEASGEASLPQTLNFTNNGATPVQILPKATCTNAQLNRYQVLPSPLVNTSPVAGLQVASLLEQDVTHNTIRYSCDFDNNTNNANFQISADTCSGMLLEPQAACSLQIAFVPQSSATYPTTFASAKPLDYFLELNTVQCNTTLNLTSGQQNPCELDGGRFPVELRANSFSPLRMTPGAGLNFGGVSVGKSSATQTVTILNDPNQTSPSTVTFVGKFAVTGNYSETDDCPSSLAAGGSCILTITFKPKGTGNAAGNINIDFITSSESNLQTQTIYLRGTGQ